ncbi:B12-binding domain-containing radical SAM protein, partial [Desulfamplus magnetovallimortis]|uniref:B12-binding domain-containing radical SAM protein n=1 Tax=Desulfamplus magnetovallimortis TaxID=1246637 RepID=UPI00164893FE
MTDILLVQPPVEDFYFTYKRSIPYGLTSIAASLKSRGFSVEILDCLAVKKSKIIPIPDEMEYLLPYYGKDDLSYFGLFHHFRHYGYSFEYAGRTAREKKPFLVGISSLFSPYARTAEKTAEAIKRFLPDCYIVMGGHHPTALPESAISCLAVDFLLRGEGEVSMPLLVKRLKEGKNIDDVPGIVFRKKIVKNIPFPDDIERIDDNNNINGTDNNNSVNDTDKNGIDDGKSANSYNNSNNANGVNNNNTNGANNNNNANNKSLYISEPAWIESFQEYPLPDFSLVNHKFYSRNKRAGSVVVAGRGCPMPCTYCSVGASSNHAGFRQRKVDDIIREIEIQMGNHDIGFIDFEDENLTLNRKWFFDLMDRLYSLFRGRDIELRAMNGLYPPSLDMEMLLVMKKAGFKT